jgi:hypothetical protein
MRHGHRSKSNDDEGQFMVERGLERMSRTAFPASAGTLAGASALMPPHSQGAERRTERRACRAGSRWGLRAIVIGGLAGAAWLLTGVAAHAADRDPGSEGLLGSGLIGSVVHDDIDRPTVGRVLQAAVQPLEFDRTAHRRHHASVLDGPVRVLARPVATLTHCEHGAGPTIALGGVDRVVRGLTGPLRLTGGPADSLLVPVIAPLTKTFDSVSKTVGPVDILPQSARPAMTAQRPVGSMPRTTAPHTLSAPVADRPAAVSGSLTATLPPESAVPGKRHGVSPERESRTIADRHVVTASAGTPETVRDSTPDGDGPAPMQGHLGAISGLSTSGSGVPTEGGSAALRPAVVAASSMAFHRLPIAADVEVRRHDAEAPTVSPD